MVTEDDAEPRVRSALVTGASRGIGRGIAMSMARQGMGLTVTSRKLEDLEALAGELRAAGSPRVVHRAADMSDREAVAELVAVHEHCFGPTMDVLVANAGIGTASSVETSRMSRVQKTLDVNFLSVFVLMQTSLPLLRRAAAAQPQPGSKVIALSSITGVYAERNLAIYGASKAALISLVETFNLEEAENGVLATAIAPGFVNTDMSAWISDTIPSGTMVSIDDVVEVAQMVIALSRNAVVSKIILARAGSGGYAA
jgi:3-oxoacyl-[acyl-carrier protein] reductase